MYRDVEKGKETVIRKVLGVSEDPTSVRRWCEVQEREMIAKAKAAVRDVR